MSVAAPAGRADLTDQAHDALGKRSVRPTTGKAPGAESRRPLWAPSLMAPRPCAEEALVGVGTPAPVQGRGRAQPAARGDRQRHRGPNQKHGDGGLSQHCTWIACKAVPAGDPGQDRGSCLSQPPKLACRDPAWVTLAVTRQPRPVSTWEPLASASTREHEATTSWTIAGKTMDDSRSSLGRQPKRSPTLGALPECVRNFAHQVGGSHVGQALCHTERTARPGHRLIVGVPSCGSGPKIRGRRMSSRSELWESRRWHRGCSDNTGPRPAGRAQQEPWRAREWVVGRPTAAGCTSRGGDPIAPRSRFARTMMDG